MVMTAGAARVERLEKSAEQLQSATDGGAVPADAHVEVTDEDEGYSSEEAEAFFPEERVRTAANISSGVTYFRRRAEVDWNVEPMGSGERKRFQRISVATHESTSPKSVIFRTRI